MAERKLRRISSIFAKVSSRTSLRNSKFNCFKEEIKRKNKYFKNLPMSDPLLPPFKKKKKASNKPTLSLFEENYVNFFSKRKDDVDEATNFFLGKKRKNPAIVGKKNNFEIMTYKQEDISFFNIIELLKVFKEKTGINYENNQLKVESL